MDRINVPDFEFYGELTAEDFQQKLYQWLEERGILPGLRTYLRHQLISALKHTHLSSEYLSRKRNHLSPKIHAFNLLVAEYLLEQNYQYTVSIFHSEEPHLGRLPMQINLSSEGVGSPKYFKEKDVEDILGSLNLGQGTKFGKKILDIYFDEKKDHKSPTLLRAIFQAIVFRNELPQNMNPGLSAGDAATLRNKTAGAKEVISTEQRSDTTSKTSTNKMNHQLQEISHQHEKSSIQGAEFTKHTVEWNQKEIERRVQDEVKRLCENFEKETSAHKKRLEEDVMSKQQQLVELMNLLRDQQFQVQLQFEKIQKKEDMLKDKETKLEETQKQESVWLIEKNNDIVRAQQKLEEDFKRLNQEQNTVKFLQKEMEVGRNQILEVAQLLGNSQLELNLLQSLHFERQRKSEENEMYESNQHATDNFSSTVQSVRSLQEHAIRACQRTISQLKDRNKQLQMVANEQRSKINALTSKASTLNNQLQEATAALRLLSSQDDQKSDLQLVDSSQQQPIVLPTLHLDEKKQPVLEEHWQNDRDRIFTKKTFDKRSRKQLLKEQISSSFRHDSDESSSSTTSSPTEEILREARRRLERLEKESDEVDRQYYKFKQKHLSERSEISALHLSATVPAKTQSLEREKSLPSYNHASATHTNSVPPSYQLQHHNLAMQFGDGYGLPRSLHRVESQPFISQLIFHTPATNRNQTHCHTLRHASSNLPYSTGNIHQTSINSRNQIGNGVDPAVCSINNNNNPQELHLLGHTNQMGDAETNLTTFNLYRTSPPHSVTETQFGNIHLEPSSPHNKDSTKQHLPLQNDFPRKETQHKIHLEPSQNKKDGKHVHITEKNHLSAMNIGHSSSNNHDHLLEEGKMDNTKLENNDVGVTGMQSAVNLLNNEGNNKNNAKLSPGVTKDQQDAQEVGVFETQLSVSSLQESSSPKLSVGISDSKDGEDSDFW